jgi:ABC-type nitrate/sulfonate/bicarbonate transport system substrate-binding protein
MKFIWGCSPKGVYNMGVFLGKAKGIFQVPGTDLTIFENLSGADFTEELIKGSFDMGTCGTPPLMAAFEKTNEYAVIGTSNSNFPPFYLIAPETIQNIEDLEGKVIAINKFRTCPHSIIHQVLTNAGIGLDTVRLVALVTPAKFIEAIANNQIEAAMLWEPWVSYAERVFNWHIVVDCPKVIQPSNWAHLIYVRRSILEDKPDLVRNYVSAYLKSIEYAKNNIHELLSLDYPMDYVTPEDIERAVKREVPLWNTNPAFDEVIAETAERDLKNQKVISVDFSLQPFVVTSY